MSSFSVLCYYYTKPIYKWFNELIQFSFDHSHPFLITHHNKGHPHVNVSHAKLLLYNNPDALIDTAHGAFGVSPLDRMASGYFIHGNPIEWAEKLRLALKVAAYVRTNKKEGVETVLPDGFFRPISTFSSNSRVGSPSPELFFPYHELM